MVCIDRDEPQPCQPAWLSHTIRESGNPSVEFMRIGCIVSKELSLTIAERGSVHSIDFTDAASSALVPFLLFDQVLLATG